MPSTKTAYEMRLMESVGRQLYNYHGSFFGWEETMNGSEMRTYDSGRPYNRLQMMEPFTRYRRNTTLLPSVALSPSYMHSILLKIRR